MLDVHPARQHLRLLDWLTVLSRLLAATLLYLSSYYLTPFDSSPSTLLAPSAFPSFTYSLFRWDAFHFTAIAKNGYSHEHHWAFFPGVPMLLRAADCLPALFLDAATPLSWLALLHTAIAIPTTRAIYHLTLIHFQSPSFALLTALLSLLPASPATLYFAPYAEPIFTFLSYQGACTYFYNSLRFSPPHPGVSADFRNARLCTRALRPRIALLRHRCRFSLEWRSACSLCPLVLVDRPPSPLFQTSTPERCAPCLPLRPAASFTITYTPAQRLPHLLPRYGRRQSLPTTLVQQSHTVNLHIRPAHLLARRVPFLLDPRSAPQHRSRAPTPPTPPSLQRIPHIFTNKW